MTKTKDKDINAQIKETEQKLKTLKAKAGSGGINYWKNKLGAEIVQEGLTYKAKNGKTYPAFKAKLPNGTTHLVKLVKGGAVGTSQDF